MFISNDPRNLAEYNNLKFPLNLEMKEFAREEAKKMNLDIDE